MQIVIPSSATTGPGAFQVINVPRVGNVVSNSVSVPIGAQVTLSDISQDGNTVHVYGTGFSVVSVINFFNQLPGGGAQSLGGFGPNGPRIPLTFVSSTEFTFTIPASAVSGQSYVQVLNPPYIPFSSTGSDPDGAFTLTVP
jgi:hypothetical protein